jgi:putative membrane protein
MRSAWIALPLIALAALAGCAPPPPLPPAPPPAPAGAPPAMPAVLSDQQFVNLALAMGASEIGMGRLARGKATRREVRGLAGRLVSANFQMNHHLVTLARHLGLAVGPASEQPPPGLAAASGPDFDRQYLATVIKAHQDTIALFESEASGGQDPRLKRFAGNMLVVLRHHLDMAQMLAGHPGR